MKPAVIADVRVACIGGSHRITVTDAGTVTLHAHKGFDGAEELRLLGGKVRCHEVREIFAECVRNAGSREDGKLPQAAWKKLPKGMSVAIATLGKKVRAREAFKGKGKDDLASDALLPQSQRYGKPRTSDRREVTAGLIAKLASTVIARAFGIADVKVAVRDYGGTILSLSWSGDHPAKISASLTTAWKRDVFDNGLSVLNGWFVLDVVRKMEDGSLLVQARSLNHRRDGSQFCIVRDRVLIPPVLPAL